MKRIYVVILLLLSNSFLLFAQRDSLKLSQEREYAFVIMDSPASLFTMRQFSESSLSLYRLSVKELNKVVPKPWNMSVQALISGLFYTPLTHEEGHRSILTYENIGSISKPYPNKHLAMYVKGVKDEDLISLRDNKLPTYIRLHTAGLESDYALLVREASLINFQQEDFDVLWVEYFMRKFSLVSYYASGLFKMDVGLKEERNELKRDIVGHDIYGAVRHLHRPNMEFYRYTEYKDLTKEERRFVKRIGWRSLLNVLDPLLIGKTGFSIQKDKYRINAAMGYGMAPFGDYIDEHLWLLTKSLNGHFYLRQFQNKDTWFPAFGVDFTRIKVIENLSFDAALHGWSQPKGQEFRETSGRLGGAVDLTAKYRFWSRGGTGMKGLSVNLGVLAKTQGFLVEEMNLGGHVGCRLGISIWL